MSFGRQDKIADKLDYLNIDISDTKIIFQDTDKRHLRRTISDKPINDIVSDLIRYVPFLLIRPFFEQELKAAKAGRNKRTNLGDDEQEIINLAETLLDVKKPLYRFDEFVNLQHLGLCVSNQNMGQRQWSNYIESYIADLKISDGNNLLDLQILKAAYESTLTPLISITIRQGFSIWYHR